MKTFKILLFLSASATLNGFCANTNSAAISTPAAATNAVPYAPAVLPGKGLAQHPFVYTGEWDHRKTNQTIFVVRDGKVVWTYDIPIKDANGTSQELGDATMLSNGNIVFCRKVGASEVTPDKKIIWNMDAPKGTEIHSIQPIGLNHVLVTVIAAGNPVIAKANTSHPGTSRLLAEEAFAAVAEAGLPPATVQLIYRTSHADGERLAADPRTGALAYTGSRSAGLKLKVAADKAGKPISVELSSVNPVLILPGALAERGAKLAEEFTGSCLMGTGQFCTSPSFIVLFAGEATEQFIAAAKQKLEATPPTPLLSASVQRSLDESVKTLRAAGAELVCGGSPMPAPGYRFANTLLRVSGEKFLSSPEKLQTEAFGNASLIVVVRDAAQAAQVLEQLEGNLTGCVYSDTRGSDDALYDQLVPLLRSRVGRLLNDKMPTGVAVSAAMNHGGPFPATGYPGFTAVGIPASLRRFGALHCFDNLRPARLTAALQNKNPNGKMWRLIDGNWSQGDVVA